MGASRFEDLGKMMPGSAARRAHEVWTRSALGRRATDAARPEATDSVIDAGAEPLEQLRRESEPTRFPRRMAKLRALGLGLGFFCVAAVLREHDTLVWQWALLLFHGFAWAPLALLLALSSADPRRAELRNLTVDSALGGFWVAAMQINALPSVLLVTMLSVDKILVGGPEFLRRTAPIQALVFLFSWVALGRPFDPGTSLPVTLACLPFMVAYPVALGIVVSRLEHRVRCQNRILHALNRTDLLTGLANRSLWMEAAMIELRRHERSDRPAALLMIDLDGFKAVNDRYGHAQGDEVLRRVAIAIEASIREIDTAARYGGDEFGVVLAETPERDALTVAERIREAVAAQVFERAPELRCTVSIGVAGVAADGSGIEGWFDRADAALYRAKDAGRNAVRGSV
jgi:diguanylate cyclase